MPDQDRGPREPDLVRGRQTKTPQEQKNLRGHCVLAEDTGLEPAAGCPVSQFQ